MRSEPGREQLGKQLTKTVNATNRPEVSDFRCVWLLVKEYHVCLVEQE
jgi:hypothetical protein